jgi:eukaryotic-like serine/threonine-protein kinase
MTPERFRQVEELYHAAREATADERAALLARADPEVRHEVESRLLRPSPGDFLDRVAIENAPRLLDESPVVQPRAGHYLGPYRIEGRLGKGGMGEVYRAIDTRLGRAVAIKIAQEQFIAGFAREARAISALNHPHICTLYDIGPNYLVMELVEGETLAARLNAGALPVKIALLYASQILAALIEAHEKGVIHRDLKPGNIMIARSGVKVLDYGLAKSEQEETVTASHMVMGTPAYMPPEQREGKPADARSDIYSFGCVLYEMLTGSRAASGRRRIPSRKLERIVSRCLEGDTANRWQSAAELQRELSAVLSTAGGSSDSNRASSQAGRSTIVLADFANATGDPVFDGALRQIMAVHLENSPRLSLLPDARVRRTLGLMGRPADAKLTFEVAAEVCERTASMAVVEGAITSLGSEYLLSLRARNCQTGDILDQQHGRAARKEEAFQALGQIVKRFGNRAAASLPAAENQPSLPTEATTPSLEAWRLYSAAMKALQRRAQIVEANSLLERAIAIDPQFAMAYAYLGRQYDGLGESELSAQTLAKAYALRDQVSVQEHYFITFNYHRNVTRNLEVARQTLEAWAQMSPGDLVPHGFLAAFVTQGSGRYEKAVEEGLKAIALNPDYAIGHENVTFAYIYQNRLAEAEALLQKAAQRGIKSLVYSLCRYFIAFLKRDDAAMEREKIERQEKMEAQGWYEHQEALTMAFHGRLKDAARLSERAVMLSCQAGLRERAAQFAGARAAWSALMGAPAEAKSSAAEALLHRSRDADYGPAFALALLGESAQAHQIEVELEKYTQDTSVQFSYLPALRALALLNPGNPNQGDPAKALETIQVAAPYDLAVPGTAFYTGAFFGALYPVYVRGLAYAGIGRHRKAAAEFQKIVDHPYITLNDPIGPMARLQLARALSGSGDRAKISRRLQGSPGSLEGRRSRASCRPASHCGVRQDRWVNVLFTCGREAGVAPSVRTDSPGLRSSRSCAESPPPGVRACPRCPPAA